MNQDVLGAFFTDCCIIEADARVGRTDLYTAYKEWGEQGRERHVLSNREFCAVLRERGFEERKIRGTHHWVGVRLRTAMDTGFEPAHEGDTAREEFNHVGTL